MKNVIQGTTLSGTGAVSIAPGAEITIRNPAGQLVPLWADRAGTQPHDNPFLTDNEGQFRVYADSGWVHVRAQKDGSVREWRYVPLGSAAAMDIGEVYEALGSGVYSSVSEGLSNSAEGDFFLVESSGSLELYRVVNGVAEQRATGIDENTILATRAYANDVAAEAESNATSAAVAAASAAYQQATEYSDSQLQTHRESGDHDHRYYTKTEVDQALDEKVDDDDPRLSDAREWTAEVVSQPEAEAGTSSVPRKWTAERVRQAIEALGGSGAVPNKGDLGSLNLDEAVETGVYTQAFNATYPDKNYPNPQYSGGLLVFQARNSGENLRVVQLYADAAHQGGLHMRKHFSPDGWSPWVEFYHTGNLAKLISDLNEAGGVGSGFPSGTRMLFLQASAPPGWTQDTSINDRVLRVVNSSGGGQGGSWTISGLTVSGTTLSASQGAVHSHSGTANSAGAHSHSLPTGAYSETGTSTRLPTNQSYGTASISSGSAGAHTHTLSINNSTGGSSHTHGISSNGSWRPAYVNVIACTKD